MRAAPRVRLPKFVGDFLGRSREIGAIRRSLAASRLVTLTGVGGVGKTRLAVRVAEEAAEHFPVGVAFVDLTPLSSPALVPQAVADALQIREDPSQPAAAAIADNLEARTVLLVVDNCEHVLPACADLVLELLKRCPRLKILATSRRRLGITGETEWRVPPLEIPPSSLPDDDDAAERLLRGNEAMELFLDRALRLRPGLPRDAQSLRAIADICRRLDGIPLAIELAAARVQALTAGQIADRLKERFTLLVGGDGTAPERQKTLRAMLDWSHELLADEERVLFRRLAVFSGGWTLEAAEAVCGDESLDVLNALQRLVEHSLVLFTERRGSEGRYGFLETVRQYAREKLARSGEEAEMKGRHCEFFAEFAERTSASVEGARQADWLDRIEDDHDNLRSAMDWCLDDRARVRIGLQIAGALQRFWSRRAHFAEGRRRCADLLRLEGEASSSPERARAALAAGIMCYRQGDYDSASGYCDEALAAYRLIGDISGEAATRMNLGNVAYFRGDYALAHPYFERALELHRECGNRFGVAITLQGLGNVAFRTGDLVKARETFKLGLAESRACGDPAIEGTNLVSLGILLDVCGEKPESILHFEQALEKFRDLGDVSQEMVCLNNLASVSRKLGEVERSVLCCCEGLELARDHPGRRNKRIVAYLLESAATIAVARQQWEEGAWLLAASDALRDSIGAPRPPQDLEDYEREKAALISRLDAARLETATAAGRSSTVDAAITRALEVVSAE